MREACHGYCVVGKADCQARSSRSSREGFGIFVAATKQDHGGGSWARRFSLSVGTVFVEGMRHLVDVLVRLRMPEPERVPVRTVEDLGRTTEYAETRQARPALHS
jgi:hypothetical protein